MEAISLSVGCLLGLMINVGFAILFAIYDVSFWWLFPIAFIANLFAQPLHVRNNILEQALAEGRFLRANFYIWFMPAIFGFAVQCGIYWVTKQFV